MPQKHVSITELNEKCILPYLGEHHGFDYEKYEIYEVEVNTYKGEPSSITVRYKEKQ